MQNKSEIITNFRNFVQSNETIDNAQKNLKKYRNVLIDDFNLKDSRCIWMSLILYKYKQEMDVSDDLWMLSRQLIISLLKTDVDLKSVVTTYLKTFNIWQNNDLEDVIIQIGGNYFNLIQIKNSIEKTANKETIEHWLPHYINLIEKIRYYCKSMNILEKLDEYVYLLEQKKYNMVKEIMTTAYWNRIEEDIQTDNLDIVYSNLSELKIILYDIVPKSINTTFINEYLDIEYIKHLVKNKAFDKEYLFKLFNFVIKILKDYDSESFIDKYDKEIDELNNLECSLNHTIRHILQKLMVMAIDLKNRKTLWNIILHL
jgi:hypothetical protein